ncbi:MAG TPA: gamma-glutamyltransferase [Rhizomicrobium sp.]|nr:gamma-glutamyltransferase [Rhizomicrobium sp.]
MGDEPYAVKAGAAVLAQGGTAADAVTAIYFTLAVTYPVAAGLGGGGVCVVHDPATKANDAFVFLARDSSGGGAYAVPSNVRGFAALQTAYGTLPWQRDVASGEGYAATGFPISAALQTRVASAVDVVRLDASLASEFLDENGQVKPAGTVVKNTALGETLSAVRTGGWQGFYKSAVAQKLASYASAQNGGISYAELAAISTTRESANMTPAGNVTAYLPPHRIGAGAFASTLLPRLMANAGNPGEATKETLDGFGIKSLPRDLGSTGFAAIDAAGQAVACSVTMNGPFGSGRTAADTGVTLARAPSSGDAGYSAAFLTPVIATSGSDQTVAMAGAGAGGPLGTAAVLHALLKAGHGEALAQRGDLRSTGLAPYDTVNVIVCQGGGCTPLSDPGMNGLGAAANAN